MTTFGLKSGTRMSSHFSLRMTRKSFEWKTNLGPSGTTMYRSYCAGQFLHRVNSVSSANPFSVGLFDVDAEENVKTSVKAYPFAQRIKSGRFQAFAQFTLQEVAHEQRSRHRPSWEEIPPGGENSAKYRRRTSSWSEYVSLQTGRVAVDAQISSSNCGVTKNCLAGGQRPEARR